MSKNSDLKSYHHLLCRLASYSSRSDFDQIFKSILEKSGIEPSMNFLLKMEFKRLQKPFNGMVDLRNHVDGECEAYTHNGTTHYFDDVARAVFEEQCENFNGYTVGVHEAVTNTVNNHRVMYQNEKLGIKNKVEKVKKLKDERKILFNTLIFNDFHVRKEERMHYVSEVFAIEKDVNFHIGKSTDISSSGCQVKVNKDYVPSKGSVINIKFRKLEEEFELGLNTYLKYEVIRLVNCKNNDDYNILRLKRITCEQTKVFDEFLTNYINGNKKRYKINLDNTVDSVYSRGYSQYSLPRKNDLNLFLKEGNKGMIPFMAIATETNRSIMEYWKDSRGKLSIQNALTSKRLTFLKKKLDSDIKDSYLYVFSGINASKEVVYYSALNEEFEGDNELRNFFCKIGIEKYDFKVFNLCLSEASEKLAYQPFSLMTDDIKIFKKLNKKPSARTISKLVGLRYVLSVRDITTNETKEDYLSLSKQSMNLNDVKRFKSPVNQGASLVIVPIKTVDVRKESRYKIKTPVLVTIGENEENAITMDLSTKGLKIKLREPKEIKKGSIVRISLPKYHLINLEYKVMNINNEFNEISLMVHGDVLEHKGRVYIRDLFNRNKNNLLNYQSERQDSELSICVQNILSRSSMNLTAYFNKNSIQKISLGTNDKSLLNDLSEKNKVNLGFLLDEKIYSELLFHEESKQDKTSFSDGKNIYVFVEKNGKVSGYLESQFTDIAMKSKFIKKASSQGNFYCLNVSFSKAGRPDMSRIGAELNYISVYALYKGKEIEDELWGIKGVADIKDITEEVISRNFEGYNIAA